MDGVRTARHPFWGLLLFLVRFREGRRGSVAIIFAFLMPVLFLLILGGVDLQRMTTARSHLQDALDAATLAAARSPFIEDADLTEVGLNTLRANIAGLPDVSLREDLTTFVLTDDSVVVASTVADVEALVAHVVLAPFGRVMDQTMPVMTKAEVDRASKNIEVALVLDITGSMAGQRIIDLKAAAKDLVDIVVQDVQTPFYTRVAVVPYSMGVNLGSYANAARGTPAAPRPISGASWSTGSARAISGVTRANPGVVTSSNHGLATGDFVWIRNVSGMTQLNDRAFRVVRIDKGKFSLQSRSTPTASWTTVSTSGFSTYSRNGTVQPCQVDDCSVIVTANNHGLDEGDGAYITGVEGMTQINASHPSKAVGYVATDVTANTFSIGVNGAGWGDYSSGGSVQCGEEGCGARVFRNTAGAIRGLPISTCVSERSGAQAYTDAAPTASARVGRNYPSTEMDGAGRATNGCPTATVRPLSSNKAAIRDMIDDLTVVGSTAGQIGIAWGWYTLSPSFNGLWATSPAGPYAPEDTIKSVIIMTDGEFNTPYRSGVIAQNAGVGSGTALNKINQNGNDPFTESQALCAAMKARGVVVYTVGFQIARGGNAEQLMKSCASSPKHVHLPESGGDLSEAFGAIGRDITRLRISK